MGQSYYSTKEKCFLEVLMTTMYLKEKRVSCKTEQFSFSQFYEKYYED